MWIYVVEYDDSGIDKAFNTIAAAKEHLWETYIKDVAESSRHEISPFSGKTYEEEDKECLAEYGYIECYGYISEIWLEVGE